MVHNDFICKVMHNILLSSGSDLQKLKQQFENSNGFFRKADNAGFEYVFTDISETFQINNVCKDYHLGTLTGHLNDTPDAVGFVLFIKSGYIDTLEGYCLAADNWPDNNFDIFFQLANPERLSTLFGAYSVYQRHAAAMAAPMLDDPGIPRGSQDYEVNEREIVYGSETKSSAKLFRQMQNRGWSFSDVEEVVRRPFTTRQSINKATGNPATVFYNRDGTYIIVDDVTNALVQISDKYDPNWVPDASIINPYRP